MSVNNKQQAMLTHMAWKIENQKKNDKFNRIYKYIQYSSKLKSKTYTILKFRLPNGTGFSE